VDLAPFRAAIDAGVDVVMAAHLSAPSLDQSALPATRSPSLLRGVLRGELKFEGVICSDDMQMKGVGADISFEEAAVSSVKAGVDLLVYADLDAAKRALAALRTALGAGQLDKDQIEASLSRVDSLRTRERNPHVARQPRVGQALARDVASRAVTLVRARGGVPPLSLPAGARVLIINFIEGGPTRSTGARVESALGRALAAAGLRATEQLRDLDPAGHEYKQLLLAAQSADAFVAITRRASAHPLQVQAVADLALFGKPAIAVVALEPYDAAEIPDEIAVIATFGDADVNLQAAADVLLGSAVASGHIPVSLARHTEQAHIT
ncbi:MAG TPA: glycoside hydrolase family 3 N-terminal domain-containing protein, partial [Candidatus Binatus sp.]|nr:glycoside hydrolase family 3 N-terminal domain-containing protein [Candidatus Binatus sp.]